MSDEDRNGDDGNSGVAIQTRTRTRKPSMYKVLMLNDDYTPMEFVVHVLERFFAKSREEATQIMLHVHRRGVGLCGGERGCGRGGRRAGAHEERVARESEPLEGRG